MNNYIKPGAILYNYARDRCYLVLERTIELPGVWRCIFRDDNGRFRIYYISEEELRLTDDRIWKTLSGFTLTDTQLNSIIRGGQIGYETLKKTFDLAGYVSMKMKYGNEMKENAR